MAYGTRYTTWQRLCNGQIRKEFNLVPKIQHCYRIIGLIFVNVTKQTKGKTKKIRVDIITSEWNAFRK